MKEEEIYPDIEDDKFYDTLYNKLEFSILNVKKEDKTDGLKEKFKHIKNLQFKTHQMFVKNLLNPSIYSRAIMLSNSS